jgi:catechol 2,3-dioxygenase-like lactoylglutathione lyase family enzyme
MDPTRATVRYMIDDVAAAIAFYTTHLGFVVESEALPAFAAVTRGPLRLILSGPGSSGRRPMPDGRQTAPGGWNRIQITVGDLAKEVERLRPSGLIFRNEILSGVGGSQIILDDPFGNPIELFQPAAQAQ